MTKTIICTMVCVCAAVCVGYIAHRRKKGSVDSLNVLDVLMLKNVFDWVDSVLPQIKKNDNEKLEINILPNAESQTLTKINDKRVYVAVLQKDINGVKKVITTKIFYANSLDADLTDLNRGNIIIIPIE